MRSKKNKQQTKKTTTEVVGTYTKEITFVCPVRGKVTQTVEVVRYKTVPAKALAKMPVSVAQAEHEADGEELTPGDEDVAD